METKTKNPIERIGRNSVRVGKMIISLNEYKEVLKETQEELKSFNMDFLCNWELKLVN